MVNSIKDSNILISKYVREKIKVSFTKPYNEEGLIGIEKELEENNLLQEANDILTNELKEIELQKECKQACADLLNIIENITIWNIKDNKDKLKGIKEILSKSDRSYASRIELYKSIIDLPRFKGASDEDKIKIAMQLGALDFSDLGLV